MTVRQHACVHYAWAILGDGVVRCDVCGVPRSVAEQAIRLSPRTPRGVGKDGRPTEAAIQSEIMSRGNALPWCQLWRNNTGKLKDSTDRVVTFGLAPGSSDLVGVAYTYADVAVGRTVKIGRFIAIEVKRPGQKPRTDQALFLARVREMGGAAIWVDNVADAIAFLHRVREGIE